MAFRSTITFSSADPFAGITAGLAVIVIAWSALRCIPKKNAVNKAQPM